MEEHFSDVEKKIDKFLQQFDISKYRVHESLHYFEEDDIGEIISLLHGCKIPKKYISYKCVLMEKFSKKLAMGENDLLLFAEGAVYLKRFFQVETAGNAAERRACGLSLETLEAHKKKFFPNNSHREKILAFMPHVTADILSFKKLNPIEFKKVFIPVFVNIVDIVVMGESDLEDLQSIRGLSYYLLREVFDDLMLFIASDILFHFSNQDKKAIEFLSYFSINESIDAKGNRYKPNPILDESNHAWNMTTIRSTMLQHKRAKQAVYDKKNSLIGIKQKFESHKIDQKELGKQILSAQETLQEIEVKIKHIHKTIDKLQSTHAEEVAFVENGEEKIFGRKVLIGKMFKKEDVLLSQKNTILKSLKEMELSISNKEKEVYVWEKKYAEGKEILANIEAVGHPMDKQYERIQRALAKTLTTR